MGLSVERRAVVRVKNNPPQAMLNEFDRWDNVKDIFAVRHPEYLEGRHLLLVDDVITTGATLTSCAKSILDVAPSCKVSVAALAVAERIAR
jgi:predicted amidophosphoribosyltransferase